MTKQACQCAEALSSIINIAPSTLSSSHSPMTTIPPPITAPLYCLHVWDIVDIIPFLPSNNVTDDSDSSDDDNTNSTTGVPDFVPYMIKSRSRYNSIDTTTHS